MYQAGPAALRSSMAAPLAPSLGVYRIPYVDGTSVKVTNDHLSHSPPGPIDLNGLGSEPLRVVAAAAGVVKLVEEGFSENRPDRRPCKNNYVWIEHANGEWTKYSHMRKGSVSGVAGLREGCPVESGQLLGIESDVGCAHGTHVHFEVGVPKDPTDPIETNGDFVGDLIGVNRIPRICGIPGRRFQKEMKVVAAPCPPVDALTAPIIFRSVEIGTSRSQLCSIVNLTTQDATVRVAASAGGSVFVWGARTTTLGPGNSIDVPILFTPTRLLPEQATLVVSSDRGQPLRVGVSGTGRPAGSEPPPPAPALRVEPTTLQLTAQLGKSSTKRLRIVNTSTQDATVRVAASAGGSVFVWGARTTTLGPGNSIDVPILFTPTRLLPEQATLVVSSDRGQPLRVGVSGTGRPAGSEPPPPAPALRVEPTTLQLTAQLGKSSTKRLRIVNTSTGALSVVVDASPAGRPIRWPALNVELTAGGDTQLEVTFTPQGPGDVTATLSVASPAGAVRVTITGHGVGEHIP